MFEREKKQKTWEKNKQSDPAAAAAAVEELWESGSHRGHF